MSIETNKKYELTISADSVVSTDKRFTMDDLLLGDNYKPLDAYLKKANGEIVKRNCNKGEERISNRTLPRVACQVFEKQLANLSVEEKEHFPICKYNPNSKLICGIYSSVEEFRKHRKTIEYLTYWCDDGEEFVFYNWNIFSSIIFVHECLKQFGKSGDQFVLIYRDKDDKEDEPLDSDNQKYSNKDFLSEVFLTEKDYNRLTALLRNKMNVILQGAPGVGKTFTAKRLAYAMMGEVDDSRIEMVQFHQNYSYEDFILGYRPDGAEFKLTEGIFYRFCQTAANHPDKEYFFIIDEINRGNLSKIFGELLMLIEKDYRGTKATLAYTGMPFSVPENLYIIGMMNTADRSLAMIDYALRRRFSFFEMQPGFDSDGFEKYRETIANKTFDALIAQIKNLNEEIIKDRSLGSGFQIGHSYFCGREVSECTDEWMHSVVDFDNLPMLSEYWFDEPTKLQRWEKNLCGVFK